MTPEQIAALTAVTAILERLGTAPVGVLIAFVLLSPWVVLALVAVSQHRRFEEVVQMYENNYSQTNTVTTLAEGFAEMAKGYRELVIWTTKESTEVKQAIFTNMYCPERRKNSQR